MSDKEERVTLEAQASLPELPPHTEIAEGAFGTGKKTVPLVTYDDSSGVMRRIVIGEAEVDLETLELKAKVDGQGQELREIVGTYFTFGPEGTQTDLGGK